MMKRKDVTFQLVIDWLNNHPKYSKLIFNDGTGYLEIDGEILDIPKLIELYSDFENEIGVLNISKIKSVLKTYPLTKHYLPEGMKIYREGKFRRLRSIYN